MTNIRRVWGTIDGVDCLFRFNDELGVWQTTFPHTPRGMYTMVLYAEDEAGNEGFLAEVVVTLDLRTLKATFTITKLGARFSMQDIQTLLVATGTNER